MYFDIIQSYYIFLKNFSLQCSKSHLGAIVMGTFNASLTVGYQSGLEPKEGDICKFKVTETVVNGEIMFVRGVLLR